MASRYTAETEPYSKKPPHPLKTGTKASYTPDSSINEHAYGKSGGKAAALGKVAEVQVGNSYEVGALPKAFTGKFGVGDNKNVSTPVSGG